MLPADNSYCPLLPEGKICSSTNCPVDNEEDVHLETSCLEWERLVNEARADALYWKQLYFEKHEELERYKWAEDGPY